MSIRQILLTGVTVMLLTTSSAWAANDNRRGDDNGRDNDNGRGNGNSWRVAPEIDAASGTSAIALLTGIVLLRAERSRSRRS